jgi:hypothetical protein
MGCFTPFWACLGSFIAKIGWIDGVDIRCLKKNYNCFLGQLQNLIFS